MDAFKLLSRSSKLSKQNLRGSKLNTPSSVGQTNPQLFGHNENSENANKELNLPTHSRKRKRDQSLTERKNSLDGVEFFGAGENGDKKANELHHAQQKPSRNGPEMAHTEREHKSGVFMAEDECRRVLKSHKVKILIIDGAEGNHAQRKITEKHAKRRKDGKAIVKATQKKPNHIFPQPLLSFRELQPRFRVDKRLLANLEEQAYKTPTEVQLASLPLLLPQEHSTITEPETAPPTSRGIEGIDLLTVAPTGSGKTLAFLIPVIDKLLKESTSIPFNRGVKAVILAPTKELAGQIKNEAIKLTLNTRLKVTLMRKGMSIGSGESGKNMNESHREHMKRKPLEEDQDSNLDEEGTENRAGTFVTKADIVVATPLAILNAIKVQNPTISPLRNVRYLILDEADVLLDPLFREQTLGVWMACINPALRISLWSATMGSNVEELARSKMDDRLSLLQESTDKPIAKAPLLRVVVGLKDSAIPTIAHKLTYAATEQGKLMALRQLLHPTAPAEESTVKLRPPFLVFAQTIQRAVALHAELAYDIPAEAGGSSRIAVLHSDLSDTARDRVMKRFRTGQVWVLITTDLLSRGIDFRGVNGVVNYDVPTSSAAYVHRVGRTGRAGREGGVAVTLYTKEDISHVKNVANVIAASEKLKTEKGTNGTGDLSEWLLDALPTPSKREKKLLKQRGVEARRTTASNVRISTKSGFERRLENRKKGAVKKLRDAQPHSKSTSDTEFEGFSSQ